MHRIPDLPRGSLYEAASRPEELHHAEAAAHAVRTTRDDAVPHELAVPADDPDHVHPPRDTPAQGEIPVPPQVAEDEAVWGGGRGGAGRRRGRGPLAAERASASGLQPWLEAVFVVRVLAARRLDGRVLEELVQADRAAEPRVVVDRHEGQRVRTVSGGGGRRNSGRVAAVEERPGVHDVDDLLEGGG